MNDAGVKPRNTASAGDEVDVLRAECDEWKRKAQRAVADYQNLQRRSDAERANNARLAIADFVKTLLPIVDDLDRTLDAADGATDVKTVTDGVRLIREHLEKILADRGIETIPTVGEPFDPTQHEAMMTQPDNTRPDKTVVQELQKGYRMDDRVLRAARVVISQAADAAD